MLSNGTKGFVIYRDASEMQYNMKKYHLSQRFMFSLFRIHKKNYCTHYLKSVTFVFAVKI